MKLTLVRIWLLLSLGIFPATGFAGPEAPKGSITIERIADVKYPTEQVWSPDGKHVAFLWDAAGKQDLFLAQPGGAPVALTDFPVDLDILTSNITHFEWSTNDEIIFSTNNNLWTVSITTRKPMRMAGYASVSSFSLSADRAQIAYVYEGQIWVGSLTGKTQKQLTRFTDGSRLAGPSFSADSNYIAFTATYFSDLPEPLPFNGNRLMAIRSRTWGQRLGVVSTFSGDPVMLPTTDANFGAANRIQWGAGNVVVNQWFSPDRKTRLMTMPIGCGRARWV